MYCDVSRDDIPTGRDDVTRPTTTTIGRVNKTRIRVSCSSRAGGEELYYYRHTNVGRLERKYQYAHTRGGKYVLIRAQERARKYYTHVQGRLYTTAAVFRSSV